MPTTIVLGIDGLSWDWVDPELRAGRLPELSRLVSAGASASVESTVPTISPVAWSSFITGRTPIHHRVFDWYGRRPDGTRRPVTSHDRQGAPFWAYLNSAGLRTGIMNVPATFPAPALSGFLISGFDAPRGAEQGFYPRSLHAELRQRYGEEVLAHPSRRVLRDLGDDAYVQAYIRHDRLLTEAAIELCRAQLIDALVLNYQTVDHFNHHLSDARHIATALNAIDGYVGSLREAFPDATWIIMSDHGSRKTGGAFLLVDWLEDHGFLHVDRRALRGAAMSAGLHARAGRNGPAAAFAIRVAARLARLLPEGLAGRLAQGAAGAPVTLWPVPFVDRRRSAVQAVSPGTCGFYCANETNDGTKAGRELTTKLMDALRLLRDPSTGRPLFSSVHGRSELFPDLAPGEVPDVVALATDADARPVSTTVFPRQGGTYFVPSAAVEYYGGHTLYGIGIFAGAAFSPSTERTALRLWDLPAVVLALHDIPLPTDFDGRVAPGLFTPEFAGAHPIRTQLPLSPISSGGDASPEDAEVEEKLQALGYL